MQENKQMHLISLDYSRQQAQLALIKESLSQFPKYFYSPKSKSTIIYDKTFIYILSKEATKIINLGKSYIITQLIYHHIRDIVVFLTAEGNLFIYHIHNKNQILFKKQCKKQILFAWVYDLNTYAQFMTAQEKQIRLWKIQEDNKKGFKQVKSISGKFACFLFDPLSQVLLAFPIGDCKHVYSFSFNQDKLKSNFKGPVIAIDYSNDQHLVKMASTKKTLGLQGSRHGKQIFFHRNNHQNNSSSNDQYFIDILRMNNKPYLIFYFGNQGKLKLYPIGEQIQKDKQLMIKLPSDSIPSFNIVDNMLVVHLKNQKITFVYDIKGYQIQTLVSPFAVSHSNSQENSMVYKGQFLNKRVIIPNGSISKWRINLPVIHSYLKNQQQIFEFFNRRKKAKMNFLKWMRQQLFNFKHLSLSKFWKLLFAKYVSNIYEERDVVSLIDIYANVFYTLSKDQLVNKEGLLSIVLECVRQALQYYLKIPNQLQGLLIDLLLLCQKYEQIVYLIHNDVIKDSQDLASRLVMQGIERSQLMLQALGLDMANRTCNSTKFIKLLAKTQNIRQLKRYLKANYESMEILHPIYIAKYLRCKLLQRQYLKFVKFFLLQKFPQTNPVYLDQAEKFIDKAV